MIRVIFDTNVLSSQHFEYIDQSPVRRLCKQGKLSLLYSHTLLEETFRSYGNEKKRDNLVTDWLPFIAETASSFCKDLNQIFHEELVQGRGLKTNIFMNNRDFIRLRERIKNLPADGSWSAWNVSEPERVIDDKKRQAQRKISVELRNEIAEWKNLITYSAKKHGKVGLNQYFDKVLSDAGKDFIKTVVAYKDPLALWCTWARNKNNYPYFTYFIMSMLYIAFHAMTKPNERIDDNAQADLNLMSHLLNADVLVSNETGFLKSAFNDLWRPKGKVLFNSQEFSDYLRYV